MHSMKPRYNSDESIRQFDFKIVWLLWASVCIALFFCFVHDSIYIFCLSAKIKPTELPLLTLFISSLCHLIVFDSHIPFSRNSSTVSLEFYRHQNLAFTWKMVLLLWVKCLSTVLLLVFDCGFSLVRLCTTILLQHKESPPI